MSTHDDDTDPTGMRALLRGLPDPGSMPDDLVARIHAALNALPRVDSSGRPGAADDPRAGHHGVSRGTTRPSQPSQPSWWARRGGQAAVAAVVLLGGGALVTGQLGSLGSSDEASTTSADSSAGSAERLPGTSPEADLSENSPSLADRDGLQAALGGVVVRHSGRDYAAAALATQLDSRASAPTTSPLTAEAPGIGPIGTELGVRSCLVALGLPRGSAAEVDLGALDGAPAAVLVVTVGGERTAYAVGRDCTTGNPAVLAGPVTLP